MSDILYFNGEYAGEKNYDFGDKYEEIGYSTVDESFFNFYAKEFINSKGYDEEVNSYKDKILFLPKIDDSIEYIEKYGLFNGYNNLIDIPTKQLDFSNVAVADTASCFDSCAALTSIPELINTSHLTNMTNFFIGCSSLESIPEFDTSSVRSMFWCFSDCKSLTTIPILNTSNVVDMGACFSGCSSLTEIPELVTSNVTNISLCFWGCTNLKRIEGWSFKSMGDIGDKFDFLFGQRNTSCRFLLIKDIGTNPDCSFINATFAQVWGIDSDEIPDARQSLIDSLLTYSYDRKSAGYSDCTITLYPDVKSILSTEEIAAIQSKGYIIN